LLELLKSSSLVRRFFAAYLQSELGTGAAYVALVLVAYHRLHSGWAIALVLLADFLPGIAFSAPFGALADRLPRRRLVVGADLLRACAFVGLALVSSFGATIALALAAGVGSALFRPAINAALPGLVAEEHRSRVAALQGALYSLGVTAGPALTALVLLFGSPSLVLAANGVTFLVSAALLSTLPLGHASKAENDRPEPARRTLIASTVEGARSAAQIPGIPMLLAIGALSILAGAVMNIAEPLLATGPLGAGSSGYSVLVGTYGAGMAVGSLVSARGGSLVSNLRRLLLIGIGLSGVGMLASAAAPSLAWALGSFALTGFANGLMMAPEVRLVQELTAERLIGRVFGLRDALGNVAFVLAFVGGGAVVGLAGARGVFAVGGAMLIALTAASSVGFRPVPDQGEPPERLEPAERLEPLPNPA
jgi:MFS family permease